MILTNQRVYIFNAGPDITPLTAASKASQVILGATTKGHGWTIEKAQTLNLMGGALASIGAGQAAGMSLAEIGGSL